MLVLLTFVVSCRTLEARKEKCRAGDRAACEAACEMGESGEGGCLSAGRLLRDAVSDESRAPELARATTFFERACAGGSDDGCLDGAQALEIGHTKLEPAAGKSSNPELITDAVLARRQSLLERACDRGDARACQRLGDVTIGKNATLALSGYERACKKSKDAAACETARRKEVQAFEHYREGCRRLSADDCTALGNLVHRIDVARAYRIFLAEGELRGVGPLVGGLLAFVKQRASEAPSALVGDPLAKSDEAPLPASPSAEVVFEKPRVQGRMSRTVLERGVAGRDASFAACATAAAAGATTVEGQVTVELVVDQTGDVWRTRLVETTLPRAVAECVQGAFARLSFGRPEIGVATVTWPVRFSPGRGATDRPDKAR